MISHTTLLASLVIQASQAVWLAGVNIPGCEFGMDTLGNYVPEDSYGGQYGCPTSIGPTQMQHFFDQDGFNVFRLPVPWQSLVNNDLETNVLDETYMEEYDGIVQACLDIGAYCIIDIHNYARWWGEIVGQGGPQSSALATTWSQLDSRYAENDRIIFGTMNEPYSTDDQTLDINTWASTLQDVVYAIPDAGATSQMILLSGTNYANAISFPTDSADALSGIVKRDGSTTNLIFELHQYFDSNGGAYSYCNDDLAARFETTGDYLRSIDRQALIGELGGGNGQDCIDIICPVLDVLNNYGDVFLGWTSWAAGSFPSDYELSEVPDGNMDVGIVSSCFAPKFGG